VRIALLLKASGLNSAAIFDWLSDEGDNGIGSPLTLLHEDVTAPIPLARAYLVNAAVLETPTGPPRWAQALRFLTTIRNTPERGRIAAWPVVSARRPVDALVQTYQGDECEALGAFVGVPIPTLANRTLLEACEDGDWDIALDIIQSGLCPPYPYPYPTAASVPAEQDEPKTPGGGTL
jgi:hypothetical protein